jgi:hypothetical protein
MGQAKMHTKFWFKNNLAKSIWEDNMGRAPNMATVSNVGGAIL